MIMLPVWAYVLPDLYSPSGTPPKSCKHAKARRIRAKHRKEKGRRK